MQNILKERENGRSPAGSFDLKNGFGYGNLNIRYPYQVYTRDYHCVDDSNSIWYNKIIDSKKVKRDYNILSI